MYVNIDKFVEETLFLWSIGSHHAGEIKHLTIERESQSNEKKPKYIMPVQILTDVPYSPHGHSNHITQEHVATLLRCGGDDGGGVGHDDAHVRDRRSHRNRDDCVPTGAAQLSLRTRGYHP